MKKQTQIASGFPFMIAMLLFLFIASDSLAQVQESKYRKQDLLIRFEPGTPQGEIDALMLEYDAVEDSTISPSPVSDVHLWRITNFPTGSGNNLNDINEVVDDARPRARVNSAGLNYETNVDPTVFSTCHPMSVDPLGLCDNVFFDPITCNNTPTKIAILDTGIGYTYDANGVVEFCVPFLFDPLYGSYIGHDFVNRDADPQDDHGHGTHIAGIIAQLSMLSNCNTLSLESYKTHDARGIGLVYDIILAVDQVMLRPVPRPNVINMSFGYYAPPSPIDKPEPLQAAIEIAGGYNILVIASAGNDAMDNDSAEYPAYPASFDNDNILSIASVDCDAKLSSFSNWGKVSVDLATLGEKILSTDKNGFAVVKSGTSQATAIVSAAAGIIGTHRPGAFDHMRMKCAIMNSATFHANLEGKLVTGGVLDTKEALLTFQEGCTPSGGGNGRRLIDTETVISPSSDQAISIYPNPFKDQLTIKVPTLSEELIQLAIYDIRGRLIHRTEQQLMNGEYVYNWRKTTSPELNMFFVEIKVGDKISRKKIVKSP